MTNAHTELKKALEYASVLVANEVAISEGFDPVDVSPEIKASVIKEVKRQKAERRFPPSTTLNSIKRKYGLLLKEFVARRKEFEESGKLTKAKTAQIDREYNRLFQRGLKEMADFKAQKKINENREAEGEKVYKAPKIGKDEPED